MKRLITVKEEQAYRLCSPDIYGLTYENAALLLHCHLNTVWYRLNRLKKKAPQLFYDGFIRPRTPKGYRNYGSRGTEFVRYKPSMDGDIIMKF